MGFPLSADEGSRIEAMIQEIPEMIVAAAIRVGDVIVMTERPVATAPASPPPGASRAMR